MSLTYDAVVKAMVDCGPADWVAFLGGPRGVPAEVVAGDIATVSGAADRVVRVGADPPWLLHIEFQSRADDELPTRLHFYNVAMRLKHKLPVATVVILLAPRAAGSELPGVWEEADPLGQGGQRFVYRVVRPWDSTAEAYLAGPLAVVPLAPLAARRDELVAVIGRLDARLMEAGDERRELLAQAAYLLLEPVMHY